MVIMKYRHVENQMQTTNPAGIAVANNSADDTPSSDAV